MQQRGRTAGILAAAAAAAIPAVAVPGAAQASSATVSTSYVRTLGGSGHATMYPSGMEIAPDGTVVIADTGNNQIAKFSADGTTQLWRVGVTGSSTKGTPPNFQQPRDLAVDSAGNIYVADNANGHIDKLSPSGAWLGFWRSDPTASGAPIGVTVSHYGGSDHVLVADGNHSQVNIFDTNGVSQGAVTTAKGATCTHVGSGVKASAETLYRMRDAVADSSGNVYVANYESNDILVFSGSGSSWTCVNVWGTHGTGATQFMNPYGITLGYDPFLGGPAGVANAIYIADSNNERLDEYTLAGALTGAQTWVASAGTGGPNTTTGTFTQLRRVAAAVDNSGDVWGADLWGNRVERWHRTSSGFSYSGTTIGMGGTSGVSCDATCQRGWPFQNGGTACSGACTPGWAAPLATDSVFNEVRGVAFDAGGDVLAMDTVNQRVVTFSPDGSSILSACGQRGWGTNAVNFNWPRGVAVDGSGDIWVADTKQNDLQVFAPASGGVCPSTPLAYISAPKNPTALQKLNWPYSIAARLSDNTIWVADTKDNRVVSYNASTYQPVDSTDTHGITMGGPSGISIDPATGHILVADTLNKRIDILSASTGGGGISQVGTITDTTTALSSPYGVAAIPGGDIAVADSKENRVTILDSTGAEQANITTANGQKLFDPENVAFGPDGNLYISDTHDDRIVVFGVTVNGTNQQGGVNGPTATLIGPGLAAMYPVDVTADSSNYYVLDAGRFRVVKMARSNPGTILAQEPAAPSTQGTGPGQFGDARAIDVDTTSSSGLLYVADTGHNRIEMFNPSTLAYVGTFGSTGKGNGQFQLAYGVTSGPGLNASGTAATVVYVADGGGRVEKFDTAGNYISEFGNLAGASKVAQPRQITVDPHTDRVYVTDGGPRNIAVFDEHGNYIQRIGSGSGTGPGQFSSDPHGVTISADGSTLYSTDAGNSTMRIEAFSLLSGNYGAYLGSFGGPTSTLTDGGFVGARGIVLTSDGKMMITDQWGYGLHQVSVSGATATNWLHFFGQGPPVPPSSGVNSPRGIHVDPATSRVVVMDYWNQRIQAVASSNGGSPTDFGQRGQRSKAGSINFAWDFAIQPGTGNIFVANRESQQVVVFCGTQTNALCPSGSYGKYITQWGKKGTGATIGSSTIYMAYPQGIAFDPTDGSVILSDSANGRIERIGLDANDQPTLKAVYGQKYLGNGKTDQAGGLNQPTAISVAANGDIWVADTLNNDIQKWQHSTGAWVQPMLFKSVNIPWGIAVSPNQTEVWIADTGNNRIVKTDINGNMLETFDGAALGVGSLNGPSDIALGSSGTLQASGHVYISDTWNNRVLDAQIT